MEKIDKDFPIYSIKNFYIPTNKDDIIKNIFDNKKDFNNKDSNAYSLVHYPIYNDDLGFFGDLYLKYYNFCFSLFNFRVSRNNKRLCWVYSTDKDNYFEYWHNHIRTSTINSVYYFNIPNKTSIDFRLNGKNISYSPVENEIIIFPNYLEHKPNRIFGEGYRISINMEIICLEDSETLFNNISIN